MDASSDPSNPPWPRPQLHDLFTGPYMVPFEVHSHTHAQCTDACRANPTIHSYPPLSLGATRTAKIVLVLPAGNLIREMWFDELEEMLRQALKRFLGCCVVPLIPSPDDCLTSVMDGRLRLAYGAYVLIYDDWKLAVDCPMDYVADSLTCLQSVSSLSSLVTKRWLVSRSCRSF